MESNTFLCFYVFIQKNILFKENARFILLQGEMEQQVLQQLDSKMKNQHYTETNFKIESLRLIGIVPIGIQLLG